MPTRTTAPARQREVQMNLAHVGEQGRRTGAVLPPRTVDEYGMENMTGIFSSPTKETPAPNKRAIMDSIENDYTTTTPRAYTPATSRSTRRSINATSMQIRSASPRKSGITGSARRIGSSDALAEVQLQQDMQDVQNATDPAEGGVLNSSTTPLAQKPARPSTVRRFPENETPLRRQVLNGRMAKSAQTTRVSDVQERHTTPKTATAKTAPLKSVTPTIEHEPQSTRRTRSTPIQSSPIAEEEQNNEETGDVTDEGILPDEDLEQEDEVVHVPAVDEDEVEEEAESIQGEFVVPVPDDEEEILEDETEESESQSVVPPTQESESEAAELPPIPAEKDNEDDHDFEPEKRVGRRKSQLHKANSRRKRKSDAFEEDVPVISSPSAKRAKRRSEEGLDDQSGESSKRSKPTKAKPSRKALADKSTNNHMSESRRKELDDVVEKIRSRPGQNKSLIVLRRETPADDTVTHTRSGRVSIKPLAWWRNEGIVYGDSPGGLTNGQRFPLNSIKEIIRTEEMMAEKNKSKPKSKGKKSKLNPDKGKERAEEGEEEQVSDSDTDDDSGSYNDPDAEDWELDTGTFQGPVSVWDNDQQTPVEEDETVDIAYAPSAIQTKAPKNSTFRYARVLSTKFFGTGIVELPQGAAKKPKNSRKMHMGFFVVQGRVTVQVGATGSQLNRFSIGKGGFWQVPRGNQYSISNEHEKTAKIFFSQACDSTGIEVEE